MFETGHFSQLWRQVAERFGIQVEYVPGNWRTGAQPAEVEKRLDSDKQHAFKAVMVVHNETSTGVASRIAEIRASMNRALHPALLIVDTISSLASMDYRHDEWEVDVTVAGSQKGLMLPPGLSFNAISEKALSVSESARLPRSYWDWRDMLGANKAGFFPFTPATNLITDYAKPSPCCKRRGSQVYFVAMIVTRERRAPPYKLGGSKSYARTLANTRVR